MQNIKKHIICILLLLTIAPMIASISLVALDPTKWGGSLSISNVFMVSFFGIFTYPLWIAVIITPIVMNIVASKPWFNAIETWKLAILSAAIGAIGGVIVLAPIWLETLSDSFKFTTMWLRAGGITGAITLPAITFVYRIQKKG